MNLRRSLRVTLVMASFNGGGAERAAIVLAGALRDEGAEVGLVVIKGGGPLVELAEETLGLQNIVILNLKRLVNGIRRLASVLEESRPDVVIAGPDDVAGLVVLARAYARLRSEVGLVSVIHTTLSVRNRSLRGKARLAALFSRHLLRHADHVVAVSEGSRQDLVATAGLPEERVSAIFNPVDATRVEQLARMEPRHRWFDGQHRVVVSSGRLAPPKDFDTVLKAFEAFARREPLARLIVLGEGPDRERLERLAAAMSLGESVDFVGFLDNPWAVIANADAFVFASRWEGFALVVAEALLCGVPVVATDTPSGPREILDGGRRGKLVAVGDADEMAAALFSAIDHKPSDETRGEVRSEFAPRAIARQYLELVEEIRKNQRSAVSS